MNITSRRLAALFVVALVVFLSPGIGALNRVDSVFGYPALPLVLFVAWAVLVAVTWLVIRRGPS